MMATLCSTGTVPRSAAALFLLLGTACSHTTEPAATTPPAADAVAPPPPQNARPDLLAGMKRDGGQRWASDDHTRSSIAAMLAAVRASGDDQGPAATVVLGQRLQDLVNDLIAGCKMTGPSHDALHTYLEVLLPLLPTMAGSDATAARTARQDVAAILARFQDYFD